MICQILFAAKDKKSILNCRLLKPSSSMLLANKNTLPKEMGAEYVNTESQISMRMRGVRPGP